MLPPQFNRYDGIQVLRLIAALLVVITHITFYNHERLDQNVSIWSFGAIGVDIFFIISGFIMVATSGIYDGKPVHWKDFVKKRILRIVPMYWIATSIKVLALLSVPAMVLHAELDISRIIMSYLFLPQFNPAGRFEPLLGVGWTLIYEMFFYAFFAFLSIFRMPDWPAVTMYFHPIILYFVAGMWIYHYYRKLSHKSMMIITAIIGVLFFILAFLLDMDVTAKAKSLAGFLLAIWIFLFFLAIEPLIHGRIPRVLLFLGEASYVLYLFHPLFLPIIPEFFARYMNVPAWFSVLISIPTALIGASIIHRIIEKPVTKWLKPKIL
ncbi:acyltransferase family protein [Acinetobacter johnsonii]|uniref:acyltransferase family protein n=1 Tax=Acinetobacter johnsonii TaxID=40214 RepID=UPI003F548449